MARSACPHCRRVLRWWELVPILSFTLLRGRCARCYASISIQYPLVEFGMGVAALLFATPLPVSSREVFSALLLFSIAAVLLVLFVIDLYTLVLPDVFTWMLLALVGTLVVVRQGPVLLLSPDWLLQALYGAAAGSGFLLSLWLVTLGRGIGLGDVKLMAPLGVLFGLWGTAVLLWLAFVAGGVVGLGLLLRGRASLKTAIPFGPFLITAAWLLLILPSLSGNLLQWLLYA